jgi:hypothetical protein
VRTVSNSTAMSCQSFPTTAVHAVIGHVPLSCRRSNVGLAEVPARIPTFFFTYLALSQYSRGPSVAPLYHGISNMPNSTCGQSPFKISRNMSDQSGTLPILKNETLLSDCSARSVWRPHLDMLGCEFRDFGALQMLRLRGGISGRRGRCGALR